MMRFADGTEESRPRSESEIKEIEEANRIASQTNIRSGKERRREFRNTPDRRAIVSSFELSALIH